MLCRVTTFRIVAALALLCAACSSDDPPPPTTTTCAGNTDCANNEICVGPDGKACAGVDCACKVIDTPDTGEPEPDCETTVCVHGNVEPCFNDCHRGTRTCDCNVWGPCEGPKLTEEVCDDAVDNDCNGKTDEPPCPQPEDPPPVVTPCKPLETEEVPCGNCGVQNRVCSKDGQWGDLGPCLGEGPCAPNEPEEETCDNCGKRTRICTAECVWSEWTVCGDVGECKPGAEELAGCEDLCGSRTRVCDEKCAWGEYGECDEEAGCAPGAPQEKDCGMCGMETAICDDACQWGDFSECVEPEDAECTADTVEEKDCGGCGTQERTCSETCGWGEWTECTGDGECAPGDTEEQPCGVETDKGECEYGTQTRTCDGECGWSEWGTCLGAQPPQAEICGNELDEDCDGVALKEPDIHEPNNSCGACTYLGTDPNESVSPSFDSEDDTVDYFCFDGDDTANPLENIIVELSLQAGGVDADIYLYKGEADCEAGASTAAAAGAFEDKTIHWDENFLSDDDAFWIVEVRNYGSSGCGNTYELLINGLN